MQHNKILQGAKEKVKYVRSAQLQFISTFFEQFRLGEHTVYSRLDIVSAIS